MLQRKSESSGETAGAFNVHYTKGFSRKTFAFRMTVIRRTTQRERPMVTIWSYPLGTPMAVKSRIMKPGLVSSPRKAMGERIRMGQRVR